MGGPFVSRKRGERSFRTAEMLYYFVKEEMAVASSSFTSKTV